MDPAWIGIAGSVLAAIGSIYAVVLSRRKVAAEADSVNVHSSDRVVQMIMGQLTYMEGEVKKLQALIGDYRLQIEKFTDSEVTLKRRIVQLEAFIRANGLPVPEAV